MSGLLEKVVIAIGVLSPPAIIFGPELVQMSYSIPGAVSKCSLRIIQKQPEGVYLTENMKVKGIELELRV
ncbi:hypothetical protein ACFL1B_00970 [Nanoarchaeota archaeon]